MPLVRATVEIVGTRPLMWHHITPEAFDNKQAKTGKAGNDPMEWKRTVLATASKQLYLEPSYIFGCIRDGASYTPRKRGTFQPVIQATVQIPDEPVLIDRRLPEDVQPFNKGSKALVYIDRRMAKNPGTNRMNIRSRIATVTGWKASFGMSWDNSLISEDQMTCILRDSGTFAGVGSARKLGFGRFEVKSVEVLEEGHHAADPATKGSVGPKPSKGVAKRRP